MTKTPNNQTQTNKQPNNNPSITDHKQAKQQSLKHKIVSNQPNKSTSSNNQHVTRRAHKHRTKY